MNQFTKFKKAFSILIATVVFSASTILGMSAANADTTAYEKIYFASGSSKLTTAAKKELRSIARTYSTATTVDVSGYVQKGVSTSNNKSLSKARAKAVMKYLKARGMTATFTYAGKGLPSSKSTSSKARRVTLKVSTATGSTVSGNFAGTVPLSPTLLPLRSAFSPLSPCAGVGNLKVTLDGATDFVSQEIDVADDCTATYSIPNVEPGTYKVVATVDLGTTLGDVARGATLEGWSIENITGTNTLQLTKSELVISADTTLDIKPTFSLVI